MLTPTVVYTRTERGRGQKKAAALVAWREHCALSPILKKNKTNGNLALFLQKHKTVADPRGSRARAVQFLSFSSKFWQKSCLIIGFAPNSWLGTPPPNLYGKSWIRNCTKTLLSTFPTFWLGHWCRIQGAPGTTAPFSVQIPPFSCSFRQNFCKIIGWRVPLGSLRPLGNAGSATGHNKSSPYRVKVFHLSSGRSVTKDN